MGELLVLRGVEKSYRRGPRVLPVLVDVSLKVDQGEIAALIGSRGEGKTTLLKLAAGLELADRGEVWLAGRELSSLAERDRRRLLGTELSWLDRREPRLRLPVRDLVAVSLVMGRGHGRLEARSLALAALDRLGAGSLAEQRWDEISNWERILVTLAAGIVEKPRLLVIDDLLDGLGANRTQEAGRLLRSIVEEIGFAVLMSVSDWDAALAADQILNFEGHRVSSLSDQSLKPGVSAAGGEVLPFTRPAGKDEGSQSTSAC